MLYLTSTNMALLAHSIDGLDTHWYWDQLYARQLTYLLTYLHTLDWLAHYAVTSAFSVIAYATAWKPTAHCNKSCDYVDLLDKLRHHRKLNPTLQRLEN